MARNQKSIQDRIQVRIQNFKPFYAVIGAGDLAVEKIREVSSDVQARSSKVSLEPKRLQADIERLQGELETAAKHRVDDVRTAQAKATHRAEVVFNDVVAQATTTYDQLTGRGQRLVNRIMRQQSTQQAKRAASTTSSQAKAATTTAKKSASSTGSTAKRNASNTASTARKNASSTASTAKKSASQTQSRAKAASTSARKTADATGTAASQAAKKVGD
jgi:heparin binding hemagglutinin HbhA